MTPHQTNQASELSARIQAKLLKLEALIETADALVTEVGDPAGVEAMLRVKGAGADYHAACMNLALVAANRAGVAPSVMSGGDDKPDPDPPKGPK